MKTYKRLKKLTNISDKDTFNINKFYDDRKFLYNDSDSLLKFYDTGSIFSTTIKIYLGKKIECCLKRIEIFDEKL